MTNSNDEIKDKTGDKSGGDHDHDHGHHHDHRHEHHWHGCHGRRRWGIPFVIAAIVLLKSLLVMVLWNYLVPDLFHGPLLTYLQAVGLTVFVGLLTFGGPGRGHFGGRSFGGRTPPWGRRHWMAMTPEEREKLREEIRKRYGD